MKSESSKIYVYHCGPIDRWQGWTPLDYSEKSIVDFLFQALAIAAKSLDWEGDINDGPYFAPLPYPDAFDSLWMVAWKQGNNGSTFIASPFSLSWLTDPAFSTTCFKSVEEIAGSLADQTKTRFV